MCDDQRVDHDPNAAIELPEDMGVRHDVACAREAARSVRVGVGAAGSGGARAWGGATHGAKVSSQKEPRPTAVHDEASRVLFPGLHPDSYNFVTLGWCGPTPPCPWGLRSNPVGLGARSTPRHCACSCPLT